MENLKRQLIKKHIGNWNGNLEHSSIEHFFKTGHASGSFLIALETMMDEYHMSLKNSEKASDDQG